MKWLNKIRSVLCGILAFIMVYAFATSVWITEKENFMMIVLFFAFCVVLVLAVLSVNSYQYEYIQHILTVPEVTK